MVGADALASLERVAEVAGVHRATVYRHFPFRDHLLHEVLSRALSEGHRSRCSRSETRAVRRSGLWSRRRHRTVRVSVRVPPRNRRTSGSRPRSDWNVCAHEELAGITLTTRRHERRVARGSPHRLGPSALDTRCRCARTRAAQGACGHVPAWRGLRGVIRPEGA